MAERRPLIHGLTKEPPGNDSREAEFVYGAKAKPKAVPLSPASPAALTLNATNLGNANRVPISTRIRTDLAATLKRLSLERQLAGQTPNTLQDIVEIALTEWLDRQEVRE